jgi:starch synthase
VGDIVRDLPIALSKQGWNATILTPSYGMFHLLDNATHVDALNVEFAGQSLIVGVYAIPGANDSVSHIVFEHALFSPQGPGKIYCSDDSSQPFATDASKFALLSACAATWIDQLDAQPDVVHLHDWHAAFYCLLREYSDRFVHLQAIRTVFTIHNLSYQGIRPVSGYESSLEAWFPGLDYDLTAIRDPQYTDCVNPMVAAIRLADAISTVSPTYATEIQLPSDSDRGFIGGEGLEDDLRDASDKGHLVGILNGCEYPRAKGRRPGWQRLLTQAKVVATKWQQHDADSSFAETAVQRLGEFPKKRPDYVVVSVGRLVAQKVSLFLEVLADGRTALEHVLDAIGSNGVLIIVGSGESQYEKQVHDIARNSTNFVFLRGYSDPLADALYRAGDLFLMPSSFEPCGISQMLAMRAGQPCVVHGVGGLKDTVHNGGNGFVFGGESPSEQANDFVVTVNRALRVKSNFEKIWREIEANAAAARFDWPLSAQQTIGKLYDSAG